VLLLNREEAGMLVGEDLTDEKLWQGLMIEGPKITAMTDGKDGGRVCQGKACTEFVVDEVTAVEETGAGDAFGSAMVAALVKGHDIETAISWGAKQAANVVKFMGAKRGLMSLEEIGQG
jgi:sugar/nucleoside kinase (ribokinase family)